MAKNIELNEDELRKKRKFWRIIFWSGAAFFIFMFHIAMIKYSSAMTEAREVTSKLGDDMAEIAMFSERRTILIDSLKWFLPFAILASLWINVARYRLRKLKKLAQNMHSS